MEKHFDTELCSQPDLTGKGLCHSALVQDGQHLNPRQPELKHPEEDRSIL
jgi:hypothetical protein